MNRLSPSVDDKTQTLRLEKLKPYYVNTLSSMDFQIGNIATGIVSLTFFPVTSCMKPKFLS